MNADISCQYFLSADVRIMSRASLRMKQYRPVSADFSKVGTGLSAVFGLNQETNEKKSSNGSNGVLLINCKYKQKI